MLSSTAFISSKEAAWLVWKEYKLRRVPRWFYRTKDRKIYFDGKYIAPTGIEFAS
jgi:hypothetical protein